MKMVFVIWVVLHGLIHGLGFAKAFGLKAGEALKLPVSKAMGILWLCTALLFGAYAALFLMGYTYAWCVGGVAVLFSQLLVVRFWKEAKFGTLPNLVILLVVASAWGSYVFQHKVSRDIEHLVRKEAFHTSKLLEESDIRLLPEPVKQWLRRSGSLGKPMIGIGKVLQRAEMKLKPDQTRWMSATAVQYTSIDRPAFVWKVDVRLNSLLNFQGRDKFDDGKGEMWIRMNSLVNVVKEKGPKIDEGTIQRYLGEMVWFPSLALSPYISWKQENDTTATATMVYKGVSGSGTFYYNAKGDVLKYTAMRFKGNEADSKRYEWVLRVLEYRTFEGITVPATMTATWKLDEGDWTWLRLKVTRISYNKSL
jgi:hypothetical protein